jgi:hypothetical protein
MTSRNQDPHFLIRCLCPYHHDLLIHNPTHRKVTLGSRSLVFSAFRFPLTSIGPRAILLLFIALGSLPGPILLLKASRRFWLCGKVGHVRALCVVYLPHSWHLLVPNFGPLAPRVADCFSVSVIFRPFGFTRTGGSLLISALLPWRTCINFEGYRHHTCPLNPSHPSSCCT